MTSALKVNITHTLVHILPENIHPIHALSVYNVHQLAVYNIFSWLNVANQLIGTSS